MGGTKILAAVINSKEGVIAKIKKPTYADVNQKIYIKVLAEIVNELISKAKLKTSNIKAISLGIPGSLNPYTGVVGLAPNIGLHNFQIKKKLQEKISIPVLIENDVNLGALGIQKFGVAKKAKNILVVFVGTGIGGAIIIDKKIYRGSNFVAGEIGHIKVDEKGPVCGCGNKGCFEAVASRSAIVRDIEKEIKTNKNSIISKLKSPKKPIKSKMLAQAVKAGDKLVVKHISNACKTMGVVLAGLTNLMNFDMIVLGGGLIEALDDFMLPKIKESFNEYVLNDASKGLKIIASKLGDEAALYGGIALAEEFLEIKV
jgi:glucokinase